MSSGPASDPRPASSAPTTYRAPIRRSKLRSFFPVRLCGDGDFRGLGLCRLGLGLGDGLVGDRLFDDIVFWLGFCLGLCLGSFFGSFLEGFVDIVRDYLASVLLGPDARLFPHFLAQVVELGATYVTDLDDLDLLDLRRVQRERPLDADAERLLADRERLARAGALALDDDALEDLEP